MPDIVDELRKLPGDKCRPCLEAADEIERLRKKETLLLAAGDRLEQQLVTVAQQLDAMRYAMRLTDEEREAIERAKDWASMMARWQKPYYYKDYSYQQDVDALCGLLERLGGEQ